MYKIKYLTDGMAPIFSYELLISPAHCKVNGIDMVFNVKEKVGHSEAQVTLLRFLHRESMEFRMVNCLGKFVCDLHPITISSVGSKAINPRNEAMESQIAYLLEHMRLRFQRILKISPLIKPTFISCEEIISQLQTATLLKLPSKKLNGLMNIDELILVKYKVDPFTLKAIGKPKMIRHFPFKEQQRYQLRALA